MSLVIRKIETNDYKDVEILTRESFWNVYRPGCVEHLVVNNIHKDKKSIEELELVAVYNQEIIGHIVYTKGHVKGSDNKTFITFGPVSIMPQFQGKGIGSKLISLSLSLNKAMKLGYSAVFIIGDHNYYSRFGFEPASKYGIHMEGIPIEDEAPFFMVKVLEKGDLNDVSGYYVFDECYDVSSAEVDEFDKGFEPKVKEVREGQLDI